MTPSQVREPTLRFLRFAGLLYLASRPLFGSTYTVTTTADSGAGSLRDAITAANSDAVADTIAFAIPGNGVHTISPASALPPITEPLTIDGYTQSGSSPNTNPPDQASNASILIEIDGTNTGSGASAKVIGIEPGGSGSVVRGLVINRGNAGIRIDGASGVTIEGCYIGTDAAGSSGLGNAEAGVVITSNAAGVTIGGPLPGARNVISGNGMDGILVGANNGQSGSGHVFAGNFIGTSASGTAALPGTQGGIEVVGSSTDILIGGSTPAERNVISGNAGFGIRIGEGSTSGIVVRGNWIGPSATGQPILGNGGNGVTVEGAGVTIGSPDGYGNSILASGGHGIEIVSVGGTIVQGNEIGYLSSVSSLGNAGWGVLVNAPNVMVGGIANFERNVIENNLAGGVRIQSGSGNTVRGNNMFLNEGLGIDIAGPSGGQPGVDANDPGDMDSGPNGIQNFPILTSATPIAGGFRVEGVLHSSAGAYKIDFYRTACPRRRHEFLQGTIPLGTITVAGSGPGPIDFSTDLSPVLLPGDQVTATATDESGNTSEFSQRMVFSVSPPSGPAAGGTVLNLTGTDFIDGAAVSIGATPATSVVVDSFTQIHATSPALSPGIVYDVHVANTDGSGGRMSNGFLADFLDVPGSQQFYSHVTTVVANGIAAGVGGGLFGVNSETLRQQMAVFLMKALYGVCYVPVPCTGIFSDVACTPGSGFGDWIEALAGQNITSGCGPGVFCPTNPVRRDQMAVFLLKTKHGDGYVPPPCQGVFADVPCTPGVGFPDWIEQLAAEQITGGCGGNNYCPLNSTTRGQMAALITKTFHLQ